PQVDLLTAAGESEGEQLAGSAEVDRDNLVIANGGDRDRHEAVRSPHRSAVPPGRNCTFETRRPSGRRRRALLHLRTREWPIRPVAVERSAPIVSKAPVSDHVIIVHAVT